MDRCKLCHIRAHHILGRGKGSADGRGRRAFRADQINFRVGVARAAFEVAVRGAHRDAVSGRCLPDGTAWSAGDLQHPHPGRQQHINVAVPHQFPVGLAGRDAAGTADILFDVMSPEHQRCLCHIGIAGVGAAANEHLLHRLLFHQPQRLHVVRLMRAGRQRFQRRQIQLDHFIVHRIRVRQQFRVGIGPVLCGQKLFHLCVCRKDGAGRAHLSTHVGNGGALRHLQRFHAGAGILIHLAQAALDAHPGQTDGLKGQIGHHRVDIMGQGLVYPEKNFFPGRQTALHIMRFDDLPGQRAALLRPLFLLFQSGPLL